MSEDCALYDAAGLGRASTVVTALTWMVRDFQAEEEWPEMAVNVALLLYDVCCCLQVPERLARELLGGFLCRHCNRSLLGGFLLMPEQQQE